MPKQVVVGFIHTRIVHLSHMVNTTLIYAMCFPTDLVLVFVEEKLEMTFV